MNRGRNQKGTTPEEPVARTLSPVRLIGGQYQIASRWPVVALSLLTYLLGLPLFEPGSVWLVGYVAFVPWVTAVCIARRSGWLYLISYLLGAAFFLTHFRWLCGTTPEGYVLGSLYLAATFPLAAWPVRHLYRRRGLSVAISLPVVWVALELLRSRGPLAFPWFLIGHSQVRLLTMIQIADLVGAFGVTFVVMLVNGWLVDLLLRPILIWRGGRARLPRIGPIGTVVMLIVVGSTIIYGRVRLGYRGWVEGPRIAVLQGDYLLAASQDENAPAVAQKRKTYYDLIVKAGQQHPDMFVLPETPWSLYLNRELREMPTNPIMKDLSEQEQTECLFDAEYYGREHDNFCQFSEVYNAFLVVGSLSKVRQAKGEYPRQHLYNSAFVYTPQVPEPRRYDKIHLVLFGEYVPFRYSKRFFWLYRFLNDGFWNPWGRGGTEYSLTPGDEFTVFPMQAPSLQNNAFAFGITICYEDAIPQVFRQFVVDQDTGAKRVSFMLNISNDGWFGRGSQQPQHLATCAFRAVENRVGIARSVNTGVSGFIRSDGSWYELAGLSDREPRAGGIGAPVARVVVDPRVTFYSQHGDLFALACTWLTLIMVADALVARRREQRRENSQSDRKTQ